MEYCVAARSVSPLILLQHLTRNTRHAYNGVLTVFLCLVCFSYRRNTFLLRICMHVCCFAQYLSLLLLQRQHTTTKNQSTLLQVLLTISASHCPALISRLKSLCSAWVSGWSQLLFSVCKRSLFYHLLAVVATLSFPV